MFKNLKLGTKIAGGFGIVLLITLGLGLTTLRNMRGIGEETTIMAKELIPQVDVLVDLEQHIREMMYHLRGYGYTGDDSFLQSSKKSVEAIKHALAGAKTLASASPHLVKLKAETGTLEARMNEYFNLTDQTREKVEGLLSNRRQLDEAAATFMENAAGYLESQYKQMIGEIQSGAGEATLTERLEKITLIHKAVSTGSQVMTANFKAQILRDTAKTQEALSHFPEIDRIISLLLAKTTQEVNKKQLTEVQVAAKAYQAAIADPSANWQALFEINNKRRDAGNSALTLTREITKNALARIDKTSEETMGSVSFASRMTAVGLGLAVALGVILAFFITRGITRVINRIVEALGDGARQVASASGQVSSASQQMAEGASEQAASLEETSSSLEEMASMTKQNADNASQADNLVKEAAKLMEKAGQSMRELTISMADISGASEETSKIVKTIDEIAFQTNLLALNAAVEAARAGEAGAGFAVVADEVRNLAMRAAEAAKTTASLIEGTVKRVKDGSSLVSTTNEAYQDVAQNSMKVADLVAEIAAASREQAQGIEQLNKAVAEMDKVVQQNAASAEENASASEELSAQAEQMNHSVAELVALVGGAGNRSTVGLVALVRESGSRKRDDGILKGPEPKSKSTLMLPKRSAGNGKMGPATRALAPNQVIPLDESDLRDF